MNTQEKALQLAGICEATKEDELSFLTNSLKRKPWSFDDLQGIELTDEQYVVVKQLPVYSINDLFGSYNGSLFVQDEIEEVMFNSDFEKTPKEQVFVLTLEKSVNGISDFLVDREGYNHIRYIEFLN